MPTFDLLQNKWLDVVRTDGTLATLSLHELLASLHRIERISEESPLTETALLRLLIALVSDGLRNEIHSEDDFAKFANTLRTGLSPAHVEAILAPLAHRSDVLDSQHDAFFDGPAVQRVPGWNDPKARQPISRLLPEIPVGTNLAHFVHANDNELSLCIACILKGRAVEAAFARGGLGPAISRNLLATISGMEPRYVIPAGKSLLETCLLNLVVADASRPSWVAIHSARHGQPGALARMSRRPRLLLPCEDSETDAACMRCGSTHRPRFAQAIIVDTYNHKGSPYGTKNDMDGWKLAGGDPHLLRSEKNTLTLGLNYEEWPFRAFVRLVSGPTGTVLDTLPARLDALQAQAVTLTVTSSSGNQAKVDDAPHAALTLDAPFLAHVCADRDAFSAALSSIFDKEHRAYRKALIENELPELLSQLSADQAPAAIVKNWIDSKSPLYRDADTLLSSPTPPQPALDDAADANSGNNNADDDPVTAAAKKFIRKLASLPRQQLAALRPIERGGVNDQAAWQSAFETVWRVGSLPTGSRRHSMREALAVVAPVFAIYAQLDTGRHHPGSFNKQVTSLAQREAAPSHTGSRPLSAAIRRTLAFPAPRTTDLLLVVDAILESLPPHRHTIDFADLLVTVQQWNDPRHSTRHRWHKLVSSVKLPV